MQPLMEQWRQRCLPSSDSATALVWLTLDSAPAFIWLKSTDVAFLPRILLLLSSNLLWILLCICPNLEHQLYNTRANLTLCIASVADDNNAWFDTPTTRPTRSKRRCPNATVYFGPSRPKSYWSDWIHIRWLCCLQTTNSMSTRIITDNPINSAMKRHSRWAHNLFKGVIENGEWNGNGWYATTSIACKGSLVNYWDEVLVIGIPDKDRRFASNKDKRFASIKYLICCHLVPHSLVSN